MSDAEAPEDLTDDKESPKKSKQSRAATWQVIGLIVVLIILVIVSVTTALLATGKVKMKATKRPVSSMMAAQDICDKEIYKDKGATLNSFTVDDRSSRYDVAMGKFKMFYQVEVYLDASRQTGTSIYYVNCFVSSTRGIITQIDYLEEQDFTPKAVRRTHGNPFGL